MNLENLVTEALSQSTTEETLSPLEIIASKQTLQPLILADKIDEGLEVIDKDPAQSWNVCAEILAWVTQSGNRFTSYRSSLSMLSRSSHSLRILFLAQEAPTNPESLSQLQESLSEIRQSLREEERISKQRSTVGSFHASLVYLEEIFPEDLVDVLTDISGAKKPTIKRWIDGGSAQWNNSERVQRVAKALYRLREERGWSVLELQLWFEKPLDCGKSPRELWGKGGYSVPPELHQELHRQKVAP